jgi:hypothetical protein
MLAKLKVRTPGGLGEVKLLITMPAGELITMLLIWRLRHIAKKLWLAEQIRMPSDGVIMLPLRQNLTCRL